MTQALTRKRMHLVALAALLALVAAMFVSLQSASAAALGSCVGNPDISVGIGDNCNIKVDGATSNTDSDSSSDSIATVARAQDSQNNDLPDTFRVNGVAAGEAKIYIGDLGNDDQLGGTGDAADGVYSTFNVTVVGFAITKLEVVDDADNTVKAGPQITVKATVRAATSNAVVNLTVPTTGLSIQNNNTTTNGLTSAALAGATATKTTTFTVNTAGAPAGDYLLTFVADNDGNLTTKDGTTEARKQASDTLTVTIGDPGMGIASATISLGNATNDNPSTPDDETAPETGTEAANGGDINLVIEVFNSLGGKSNSSAVNQIIVIAPGGTIASTHLTGDGTNTASGDNSATLSEVDANTEGDVEPGDVGQRTVITITKTDKKPGTVTAYAIVSGSGGAERTSNIDLTFTGSAGALQVDNATDSLMAHADDSVTLEVRTQDASGNAAAVPTAGVSVKITDPDGKRVNSPAISWTQPTAGADRKHRITLTGTGSATAPLVTGTYTAAVTSGSLSDSASFVVAGPAASIVLAVDNNAPGDDDAFVTATATVTDAGGNTVSDDTTVNFSASGNNAVLDLVEITSGHKTKGGVSEASFVVIGPGRSVVAAVSSSGKAAVTVNSTAGAPAPAEPAPAPAEPTGVDCLSNLSGFSTWTCEGSTSAMALFNEIGVASAVSVWNGSGWDSYTGGFGSVNAPVTQYATLYITR